MASNGAFSSILLLRGPISGDGLNMSRYIGVKDEIDALSEDAAIRLYRTSIIKMSERLLSRVGNMTCFCGGDL